MVYPPVKTSGGFFHRNQINGPLGLKIIIPMTWKVANNHGDRVRPQDLGLWDPLPNGLNGLEMRVTTHKTWDDPGSSWENFISVELSYSWPRDPITF